MEYMSIDSKYLNKLRKAYIEAHDAGKSSTDTITIDDRVFVMGYLKYLIEYAETELSKRPGP